MPGSPARLAPGPATLPSGVEGPQGLATYAGLLETPCVTLSSSPGSPLPHVNWDPRPPCLRPVLVPGSRRAASTQWELGMRVPPACMQPPQAGGLLEPSPWWSLLPVGRRLTGYPCAHLCVVLGDL